MTGRMRQRRPPPTPATRRAWLLREMLRIRRFEETCVELYSAAKIRGFLHLYIGEEAVAVGVMQALDAARTPSSRPTASTATPCARGIAAGRDHGRDVRQASRAAAAAAAARCTCSTRPRASTAATPSSAAACRSPSGWRWPTRCSGRDARHRLLLRRRRGGRGRVPRVAEPGGAVAAAGAVLLREQPVRHGHGAGRAPSRRPTSRCKAASYEMPAWAVDGMDVVAVEEAARAGRGRGPRRRRPALPGAADLPLPGPLDVRPRALPRQGGGRAVEASATRSTALRAAAARRRPADRRRAGSSCERRGRRRDRRRPSRSPRPARSEPVEDLDPVRLRRRGGP